MVVKDIANVHNLIFSKHGNVFVCYSYDGVWAEILNVFELYNIKNRAEFVIEMYQRLDRQQKEEALYHKESPTGNNL